MRQCIVRECCEELGISNARIDYIGLMRFHLVPDYFSAEYREEYGCLYGITLKQEDLSIIEQCRSDREEIGKIALLKDIPKEERIVEIDKALLNYYGGQAMDKLELYVPKLDELWFRRKMMSDSATMSYNANWDVDYDGYHRDSGCIDFPEGKWAEWYNDWINNEPERFYAYIRRDSDGAWIGEISFHHTPEEDWWDMGVVIYAPYRGKGYSVPALRLMLNHAFRDCGINRLHNDFEVTRPAGLKIHLAVGFKETGIENGIQHVMLTKEEYLLDNKSE